MCLAIPGKILSIKSIGDGTVRMAKASFGGIIKEVSLELIPEAQVNDYVLVHVGVALSMIDEEEANKVFEYLRFNEELNDLDDVQMKNLNDITEKKST